MRRASFAALLAIVTTLLVPSTAHAALRMKWDCYLPGASVDCVVLESALIAKIPFVALARDATDADVIVAVTSVPAEDGTRFILDLTGPRLDGYVTEVHTTDRVPSSIDASTATVRLLTKLERGLAEFMDQKVAAEARNGQLLLELVDPKQLPFTGRPQQGAMRWFVGPSLATYLSDVEGVGVNASGSAAISFNRSGDVWRVQQSIVASYSRQSQPVPGTTETASIDFTGGSVTNVVSASTSETRRWNVAALLGAEKNPQANYTMRANGAAGVEFDLVPRQTVNMKNLGFRCAVGPELQRYDVTNVQGRTQQVVARQFCDAFLSWHFVPVDLWLSASETSIVEDIDYRAYSASFSAGWRLSDNLTIGPSISVQQVHKAIDEAQATNVVYADPRQEIEASMLAAVRRGYTAPFGVQTGLSVRYLFGNGSLAVEDQRWKNATNLR